MNIYGFTLIVFGVISQVVAFAGIALMSGFIGIFIGASYLVFGTLLAGYLIGNGIYYDSK